MVKLLACDVDGTLMQKGDNVIPMHILELIGKLQSKGVAVAIASGRSHADLARLFSGLPEEPYYICNDGACTVYGEKRLSHSPISPEEAAQLVSRYGSEYDEIALYGINSCGIIGKNTAFTENENIMAISSVREMKEQIYKIGIYSSSKAPKPLLPQPHSLRLCSFSEGCVEYVSKLAEKGTALSNLQMHLMMTKYDTAAIGNYFNDVRMLKNAKYTATTPSAPEEVAGCAAKKCKADEFLQHILNDLT